MNVSDFSTLQTLAERHGKSRIAEEANMAFQHVEMGKKKQGKYKQPQQKSQKKKCDHCGYRGHTIDECRKKACVESPKRQATNPNSKQEPAQVLAPQKNMVHMVGAGNLELCAA
jgi:hypothetical protein